MLIDFRYCCFRSKRICIQFEGRSSGRGYFFAYWRQKYFNNGGWRVLEDPSTGKVQGHFFQSALDVCCINLLITCLVLSSFEEVEHVLAKLWRWEVVSCAFWYCYMNLFCLRIIRTLVARWLSARSKRLSCVRICLICYPILQQKIYDDFRKSLKI